MGFLIGMPTYINCIHHGDYIINNLYTILNKIFHATIFTRYNNNTSKPAISYSLLLLRLKNVITLNVIK